MTTRRFESSSNAERPPCAPDLGLGLPEAAVLEQHSRFVRFPAGVLEANGFEEYDISGFYVAVHGSSNDAPRTIGAGGRFKPTALGYLRTDVSGICQLWDEACIRRLATRFGYDFAGVVVYDPASGRPPLARLKAQATRLAAEAVVVPGAAHFQDARIPVTLLDRLEVITCFPEETYSRRPSLLPDQSHGWPAR